jgi:hypothetical protein
LNEPGAVKEREGAHEHHDVAALCQEPREERE